MNRCSVGINVAVIAVPPAIQYTPLLHNRQTKALSRLDLLPAAAEFADRIGREDVYLLFAELRFAALDLGLELFALVQQRGQDVFFRDVGHFFALDVDDPAAVAGEDRDVGAFAFAGAVHDAAHHR